MIFKPNLTILLPSQLQLWPELDTTPEYFTLYGGTALALRLGHRFSVDFVFFPTSPLTPTHWPPPSPTSRFRSECKLPPTP